MPPHDRTPSRQAFLTLTALAVVCLSNVTTAALAQSDQYAVIDIGGLGGGFTKAWGINNSGTVTGVSFTDGDLYYRAFQWSCGGIQDLGSFGGPGLNSHGDGINDMGDICGWSDYEGGAPFDYHTFVSRDGVMYDLGTLGGDSSEAYDINDVGIVVGVSETVPGDAESLACKWVHGVPVALPGIGGRISRAFGVNNAGFVVGKSGAKTFTEHAVYWTPNNEIVELDKNRQSRSTAMSINDAGWIVGQASAGSDDHAHLWVSGHSFDIHDSAEDDSLAWAINNNNQVVGHTWSYGEDGWHFYWDEESGMVRLEDLAPTRCDWIFRGAFDINDLGQIVGSGQRTGDGPWDRHGFLMTPVYPSFDLSQPSPAIAGKMNGIQATNVEPGAKVYFVYGFEGGGTLIPTCDVTVNALQIDNAQVAGSAIADINGVAELRGRVAKNMSGRTLLFQALIPSSCEISNLVVQKFE
ncbi:MAG: hypothetical protein D8M59_15840 [Planctomycetes bacterium]|nr:hypothetical protein [Planctomycetota bacterium]NOG52732.1 hypothetical protein [Planctomycetota bacterium]